LEHENVQELATPKRAEKKPEDDNEITHQLQGKTFHLGVNHLYFMLPIKIEGKKNRLHKGGDF
jgi:hypothetical protein